MLFKIAWRDLCSKPMRHILTVLAAAASIALSVAVTLMSASVEQGMTDATMPFDLIVGAKGSDMQLVFNTIFLQDTPIGNIDGGVVEQLENDERVRRVIPFGFGDSYEGYRIMGSTTELFDLRPSQTEDSIFQLADGRFYENEYEAVLGAQAAKALGLKVGDTFLSVHGLHHGAEEEKHGEAITVVGILETMNRPYDAGIFVTLDTLWELHGTTDGSVTALMVTPYDYAGVLQIYQEINNGKDAQAVMPGVVMGEVYDMLGQTKDVMNAITWVALTAALIGMAVSLSWAALNRMRDNAILRAIGAARHHILAVVLIEEGIVIAACAAVGLLTGHLAAWRIALYMQEQTAMYSPVSFMKEEFVQTGAACLVSLALSLIPALRAYRADMAKNLTVQL